MGRSGVVGPTQCLSVIVCVRRSWCVSSTSLVQSTQPLYWSHGSCGESRPTTLMDTGSATESCRTMISHFETRTWKMYVLLFSFLSSPLLPLFFHSSTETFLFRPNHSTSDCADFLHIFSGVVCLSVVCCLCLCCLSDSCIPLKLSDKFRCHLACTLAGSHDTLC